nr:LysR substrate-binding domain-containing protein [uncultured Enterobacter sp.]
MAGKLQLPPLQALVVFEAAARLGNFTAAGNELGLSQPAVSQRIQALENRVNSPLFERRHRGVQLTDAGNSLYLIVRASLNDISEQLERTRHRRSILRIDTDMGFASYWLMPRLERLQALIPGVEVQVTTSPNDYNFRDSNADLAIYYGQGNWAGTHTQRLFPEVVFPVCHPALLDKFDGEVTPIKLAGCPLLKLPETRPQRWLTWDDWFRQHQVFAPAPATSRTFNAYSLVIQAALEGQGIALGWQPLITPFVQRKQLVQCGPAMRTERGYYLISASGKTLSAQHEKVQAWLLDEAWGFRHTENLMPEY